MSSPLPMDAGHDISAQQPVKEWIFWGLIALTALYYFAELQAVSLPDYFPILQIRRSQWGWSYKACGIFFSCLLLVCFPWLRQNVGLRWRQAPGSWRLSLGIFCMWLAIGILGGFYIAAEKFSLDKLLFQATMPSMEEELTFRGIMLALLERAFGHSPMSCRLRYGGAAFITSLLFWHDVAIQHGNLIVPLARVDTMIFASLVALVRTRSGSLLWPMLIHSAGNVALSAVPMLR
ncbi:MAG TPA: CPBP family intramembrane glutamic endopeptidase [Pirellulales bacterium]|nr:CPBP family intramembrane glutamic endopeptidase [Pirellulales bacterium]